MNHLFQCSGVFSFMAPVITPFQLSGSGQILYNHDMKEASDKRVKDENLVHGEKMKESVLVVRELYV